MDLTKLLHVMKITAFILLVACLQVSAKGIGQSITLKVKDAPLETIFSEIKKQSGYVVFYEYAVLSETKPVTIDVKNVSVEQFLKVCFKDQPLDYDIEGKTIIVRRIPATQMPGKESAPITISGRVTDSKDNPMRGVSVNLKGTTLTVATDENGSYSINVEDAKGILVFTYVGYKALEVAINGKTNIIVSLEVNPNPLNEVVVVAYGTTSKKNLTGSIATIKGDEIKTVPSGNVENTLAGRLPGLIAVNTNGEPGFDASQLSIRGFSNMLVIVDGVANDLGTITPNEIESISVLKDASASIYGARAGNGVILVTTKRGASGRPKFSFTAARSYQRATVINEMVDAATYAEIVNQVQTNSGGSAIYTNEEIQKFREGTDPRYPNTNWRKVILKDWSPMSTFNLNTSGGSETIKYFFSMGYIDQGGMLKTNAINYKKYNLRSNIDAKISKRLSVSLDFAARLEIRNSPGSEGINWRAGGLSYASPALVGIRSAAPIYPAHYPDPTKLTYAGTTGWQPIATSDPDISGYTKDERKNVLAQFSMRYEAPVNGLTAKAAFTYGTYERYQKDWRKQYSIYKYDYLTEIYSLYTSLAKNQLQEVIERGYGITSQFFVNYDKKFDKHKVGGMLVGEYIISRSNNFSAYREGYISTAIDQLFAGADLNKSSDGSATQDGRIGYAGRLNYDFSGKYFVEATARYDASSKFAPKKRWGFFPGVSAAWRLSEERFMKDMTWIDQLKIRASYGLAGNDYVGNYNYLTGYQYSRTYIFGGAPILYNGIVSKGEANPNLTWEHTATSNLGVEASFLKGLIGVEVDMFYRKVTNVPGYRSLSLPYSYGATLPQENINSFNDRGFEFVLKHRNNIGKLSYSAEANITWARSKWIHYDESVYVDAATRERLQLSGQWKNRRFGYEAVGLFQTQNEIDDWSVDQDLQGNATIEPGDIKYLDYNGDGKLDSRDEHVIGRGNTPEIMFGLNATAAYGGFDFSMLWQGASNVNKYDGAITGYRPYDRVPAKYELDHWTPENTNAKFPRADIDNRNNSFESTYWLQNAQYIRLKSVQLGYTFRKTQLSKVGIDALKLYIAGYNILTFTKVYTGDPELPPSDGFDEYPQQKVVSFGLNLNF